MGSRQEKETADYHAELQPLPQGPGEYWILGGLWGTSPRCPMHDKASASTVPS